MLSLAAGDHEGRQDLLSASPWAICWAARATARKPEPQS